MEQSVETLFMRVVESLTRFGLGNPDQLAEGMVHVAHVAIAFIAMLVARRGWKTYRKHCKPSAAPIYYASKDLSKVGGWAGLALLPVVVMETALLPLQGLMALFMPRPKAEKVEVELAEKAEKKDSIRKAREAKKVRDQLDQHEEAIRELLLNFRGLFNTVKTQRQEIAHLRKENELLARAHAPTEKLIVPKGAYNKRYEKHVIKDEQVSVPTAPWARSKGLDT